MKRMSSVQMGSPSVLSDLIRDRSAWASSHSRVRRRFGGVEIGILAVLWSLVLLTVFGGLPEPIEAAVLSAIAFVRQVGAQILNLLV